MGVYISSAEDAETTDAWINLRPLRGVSGDFLNVSNEFFHFGNAIVCTSMSLTRL